MKQFKLSLDRFEIIAVDNYNFGNIKPRHFKKNEIYIKGVIMNSR